MKYVVWLLVLALVALHQDYWQWTDARLVGGVVPRGLAYHVGLSLAAAVVWLMACRFAWPIDEQGERQP